MDAVLQRLTGCHSTPGDEGEVREALESFWRCDGWRAESAGHYALFAREASGDARRPVLLVCAHMDSPGFSVDRLSVTAGAGPGRVRLGIAELGTPECGGKSVPAVLKTRQGRFGGAVVPVVADGEDDCFFEFSAADAARADVRHGDRVCFQPHLSVDEKAFRLRGSFLDDRLGCWMLARLAGEVRGWQTRYEVVLGATASEEMCGFGARVLAAQVRPDLVVVLDTTYESEEQGVRLGGGPVLTLSDTSVLIGPALRDRVLEVSAAAGVPLQTEVYNFSGTDARAFPQQGLPCPVLPLLIPTRGNHAPVEEADLRDCSAWPQAVRAVAEHM